MRDCCNPICEHPDIGYMPGFMGFTAFSPVVPASYWQVKSEEQRYFRLCEQLSKLICYAQVLADKINLNRDDIAELQELFEKFMESGFDDYYAEQVKKWINEHLQYVYENTIQQVFFGLDDSGYLIAYVPVGWHQITFQTPLDYSDQTTYGRLCLIYDFDAQLNEFTEEG